MRALLPVSLFFVLLGLYSCDKIKNPVINKGNNASIPVVPPYHVDSTSATDDTLLKVLVEDYTGHLCTNCPTAASQCELLSKGADSNQLVMMQVNVTNTFAHGYPNPDTAYGVDYRTTAGNNWNTTFIDGEKNGMPGTMVDRLYYNGNAGGPCDLILNGKDVSVPFDSLVVTPQTVRIHIADSMYTPPTSTVSMTITTTLSSPQAGTKYYLVVGLVEDSIYDWQDSSGYAVQYYLKRMTLRDVINGGGSGWGDTLSDTTAPQSIHYAYYSSNFQFNSAPITIPPKVPAWQWNMAHMYVVAFVYQRVSGKNDYMVLQAQKLHL